ncbi:hypothetical protein RUM43_012725 [Polyplax serrata]|uniref:Uncharacterized protein n=1 Tax=Polyplax serrata TaxID=468196 RepID=A0AAN8S419_POLSC
MDENQLIGVYIHQISFFDPDFLLNEPFVEVYLVDKPSGGCIKGNSSVSNINLYKSPFMLDPGEVSSSRPDQNWWKRLVVIDKNISSLNSDEKMLIFEICKTVQQKDEDEIGSVRIAMAFLVPKASDGSLNTNQELKLQLFKIRKDCKTSHQDCNIYHLYSEHKLKKLYGTLQISVKGVVPIRANRKKKEEKLNKRPLTVGKEKPETLLTLKPVPKTWEWSRLPTQSCKVPNKIHKTLNLGKNGVSCIRFSNSGAHFAAAVLSLIVVYEVISGNEVVRLHSHIGFIYELDWSFDDKYLLSVSNDCMGAVWLVNQTAPVFVLPHPSYVYCGRWLTGADQIITGGKDHLIRYWRKTDDSFHLVEEIGGHSGFISALATQDEFLLISGDSLGTIMIRKLSGDSWVLTKKLSFSEMAHKVIDSILVHSSRRRVIVSVRSKSSHLVDFVSGIILQTYKSAVNTFARSVSCLTPCGSYLFSFCQNGDVGVWEVNTGKMFASYSSVFPIDRLNELSGYIDYHPHEHMVGIVALVQNYPLLILKFDPAKNDEENLGLSFCKKKDKNLSVSVFPGRPLLSARDI